MRVCVWKSACLDVLTNKGEENADDDDGDDKMKRRSRREKNAWNLQLDV